MKGKVWLVGAGPGDAGLLTIKGKEVLEHTDVVVYDALVGDGVLAMIPEKAERIFAGKRSGKHFLKQEETNRILLEEAQKGKKVVRLKGGDPFLFGRGGEELELLAENGIDFEVIPGITSAIAVPAYNGIPVTHRDFCSSVHFIAGHKRKEQINDIDFKALVDTKGTLVFLMGIAALPYITKGLLGAGMDPETPAAVLEKGTTAKQHKITAPLNQLEEVCSQTEVQTPAIIVIGKVVSLSNVFAWYEKRPLGGVKVVVTRPKELSSSLAALLRKEGAEVLELPAISIQPVENNVLFQEAFKKLRAGGYDWIVFTSPSGVRVFWEELVSKQDVRILAGIRIAAIGKGSEKALKGYGIRPDFIPSVYDGETLGKELADVCGENARILIPRASNGNEQLPAELNKKPGVTVDDIATYDTTYHTEPLMDIKAELMDGRIDFAVFTSASTVRGFAESLQEKELAYVKAVCIGKQTKAQAELYGMQTWTAKEATLSSLVECVKEAARMCHK